MPRWIDSIGSARTPLRFFFLVSKPYLRFAVISSLCVIGASFLNVFSNYLFKLIVDNLTLGPQGGGVTLVWFWTGVYVFGIAAQAAFWRISGFAGMRWSVGLRATAGYLLSFYVTQHSIDYFHGRFGGAIGGKIGNAAESLKKIAEGYLWGHLDLFVALGTGVVLTFVTSPLLGWIFLSWTAGVTSVSYFMARKRAVFSSAATNEDTRVRGRIIDMVTNIAAVQDFARRTHELLLLQPFLLARYRAGIRNWTHGEISRILVNIFQVVFIALISFASIYIWTTGALSVGDIVLILTLTISLSYRVEELGRALSDFGERYGEIQSSLDDILITYSVQDAPKARALVVTEGAIEFKNASFVYVDGKRSVLNDFSLTIPAGQKVGLVGKSGAGKSTLLKLLLRQYDVASGEIVIDGKNIAQVTQESLRAAIATVPQEPLLFHRTIKENIAYGKPDATQKEIEKAATLAYAHDFIEKLPHKYDTLVGERGVKLSGGERQRVALARALLKDAKILILDEATSSLDSESEAAIQEALHALMEGKTVIAIAHRLSTLKEMDRIVVLQEGKIIEDGSHVELLKKGGVYAGLWEHQSGGYLQEDEE